MNPDFLKNFNARLDAAINEAKSARLEDDRRRLMSTIGQDLAQMMAPFLQEVASTAKTSKEGIRDAMFEALGTLNAREMNIDTTPIITAIEKAMGNILIPAPKVTVTSPQINIPDLKMPDEMNIKGWVDFMDVFRNSSQNPISVQLRDHKGNPV